eukprot:TRINITY_DN4342_c0_g1_i1.p1 TRINITY_DN4342_c0_g1~~TRINITY_DN4342_c0_g1_i1.p1  ORF type:complete len:274 (-),score=17.99 TRINITY_DN4342_c0_g1_i1:126-947(-)
MSSRTDFVRKYGFLYIIGLWSFIGSTYFVFVFITVKKRLGITAKSVILLIIFHIAFIMFLFSYFATACSDPGRPKPDPLMDPRDKKHYCERCSAPKPERTHHCSLCNRCVLNMDHHCPWVRNCVGFRNKKFFVLMLFYVGLTLLIGLCGSVHQVYTIISDLFNKGFSSLGFQDLLVVVSFGATLGVFILLFDFLYFHIRLALINSTTLENLYLRSGKDLKDYDVGYSNNWMQVFGPSVTMWFCPFFTDESQPMGDGAHWVHKASMPQNYNHKV